MNENYILDDNEERSIAPGKLLVTSAFAHVLSGVASWAMALSIMGMIYIVYFMLKTIMPDLFEIQVRGMLSKAPSAGSIVINLIVALIYTIPVIYLFSFARKLKTALHNRDEYMLTESFKSFKSHYRFLGVATIAGLSLAVIGILIAVMSSL